jgi:hypothetical protein
LGLLVVLAAIGIAFVFLVYGGAMVAMDSSRGVQTSLPTKMPAPWLVAIMCLLLAGAFFAWENFDYQKADQAKTWPVTKGTVEKTWGEHRRSGGTTYYCNYSYQLDGKKYTSSQIHVGDNYDNWPFEKDKELTVHYNPADPSDAVIKTSLILNSKGAWAMGSLLIAGLAFIAGFASDYSGKKAN